MARQRGYITRQAERLTKGEINRRRFVMSALSAGVTMPTAMSLASKAEAAVPKRGGTFRAAIGQPASTHPAQRVPALSSLATLVAFGTGNALTEIAPDGKVIGELADAFGPSDGGRTWHVRLRSDVTFNDGTPLSAKDVVATLDGHPALAPLVRRVTSEGAHDVQFQLNAACCEFAKRLSDPRLIIRSAHDHGRHLTGAYQLEGCTKPDGDIYLIRNTNYWKPGRAHFDAIVLKPTPDRAIRQNAILAGDVDYADGIDPRACALLCRTPGLCLLESDVGRTLDLHVMGDPNGAAAAILHGLDESLPRQAILDQLLLGHGTTAKSTASRAALAKPLDRPLELAVIDAGVPSLIDAVRIVATHLDEVGMDVQITFEEDTDADLALAWRTEDPWSPSGSAQSASLVKANEISACNARIAQPEMLASHAANGGGRLLERWWFT